ncbi:MAG: hypothetical protein ACOX6V_03820 [Patescibacteria group bacterium]|jgi:hypothetical protein
MRRPELLSYIPPEERTAEHVQKTGVVFLIIDPKTRRVVYGVQKIANGRGEMGQYSLNGESSEEKEDPIMTLARGIEEELNGNGRNVLANSHDLGSHYLGQSWFGRSQDVLAHVFWFIGREEDFQTKEYTPSEGEHDDFHFKGFISFGDFMEKENVRPRMKELLEYLDSQGLGEFINETELVPEGTSLAPLREFLLTYFRNNV